MFAGLLDALFPVRCAGCGAVGMALCGACEPAPGAVRRVALEGFAAEAAGRYAGALRRAVLAYKGGRRDAGDALADLLVRRFAAGLPRHALLVPIPTLGRRRRERGFDQSVRLARALGERSGLPVVLALRQITHDAQRGRSRAHRLRARGRFRCEGADVVAGAVVVLIDDVVTTGATLNDAALALAACDAAVAKAIVVAAA